MRGVLATYFALQRNVSAVELSGAACTFNEIVILTTRGSDRIELYLRDYGTRQP